jgi:hexosaminidase
MKTKIVLLILFSLFISTAAQVISSIVPKPVSVEIQKGNFIISPKTQIWIEPGNEMQSLGDLLSGAINSKLGAQVVATSQTTKEAPQSLIQLELKKEFENDEAYSVTMTPGSIKISARSGSGLFYGIQSLLQLFPIETKEKSFAVQCMNIKDEPRFAWRGVHLDVCRHFFSVEFIKKYIDVLAMYKMNTFHWHLTEDQGWRIEIKKYPKLTEIGSIRKETMKDGKPHGGFYTQEQIKEVVEYARQKYITVVPEIEMPGHSQAALSAYPELSCTGGPFEVGTVWGVIEDVYCAGDDKTFEFLQDVLTEVMELFPGKIIHIGGDECPKTRWKACEKCQARIKSLGLKDEHELQSYFIQRIEKFVNSKGKKIIGWDEILEGGLAPNAAVMSWRGISGGIAAAKANHFVVMSPGTHCYFDHYQGLFNEPKAIGGFTSLEKVYSYEPVPAELNEEEAKYIMGAQANMWTEYIETTDHVEYMLLPRMLALSEVVWSPKPLRNVNDFLERMKFQYDYLLSKNYNFRIPTPAESGERFINRNDKLQLNSPITDSKIYYTTDNSEPTSNSLEYTSPLIVGDKAIVKAKTFLKNGKSGPTAQVTFTMIDSTKNGLTYKLYLGEWLSIPSFDILEPVKTGKVFRVLLKDIQPREDFYSVLWEGKIKIDTEGEYTFYLSSDDGSKLVINGKTVVDNDETHGIVEKSGKVTLTKGLHPLQIMFFENSGGQEMKLEYEGPNITRRAIPASAFFIN